VVEDRAAKGLIIWTMSVGLVLSGLAFAYKIASFIYTLSSPDFKGTFDVSITVYFFVSAGWLCLLAWCLATGKFREMERSKDEMIRQEEEYARQGI
jgi:hypothetical protein